ncbi:MAG: S-layer homology domain-containing protein, partial [Clostridiales bacterium]
NQFTDVAKGAWYSDAIAWAQSKSIIKGYGEGIFGVKDSVTREQAATILYNYAKYKGYDVAKTKDISAYSDFGKVATWAKTPLAWANAQSLISGRTAQTLAPKDTATRAEIASILQRFVNNIAK